MCVCVSVLVVFSSLVGKGHWVFQKGLPMQMLARAFQVAWHKRQAGDIGRMRHTQHSGPTTPRMSQRQGQISC